MKLSKKQRNKLFKEFNSYSQFGLIGESAILNEFVKFGLQCYLPYGDLERCDIVVSFRGILKKIQIKSVYSINNGCIRADLISHTRDKHANYRYKYNSNDIDYIAIYSYELDQCFLIPIEEIENMSTLTLRLDPTKNNNLVNIRWAEDYYLPKVVNDILKKMDKDLDIDMGDKSFG